MKVLLVIPPFYQPNSLYPSTSQLNGFLRSRGVESDIEDLSLNVLLHIFSRKGLSAVFQEAASHPEIHTDEFLSRIYGLRSRYIEMIEDLISFLQGKHLTFAHRILQTSLIPATPYVDSLPDASEFFGPLGKQDHARYICSIVLDELSLFIQKTVSPHFGLSRYAEKISLSPPTFDTLYHTITQSKDLIAKLIFEETDRMLKKHQPDVIGYSVPFPGNLPGMFLSARRVKKKNPNVTIVVGGGFPNTELRNIRDPRIFEFIDYLCLDDGEMPLWYILKYLQNPSEELQLVRTFYLQNGSEVGYLDNGEEKIIPHDQLAPPSIGSLDVSRYFSVTESLNPMHRLWSEGFWNKMAMAHGCYWHRCTFCDITLDYIRRYSPAKASTIVDWMESLIEQTGETGFHFVDEAAPPTLIRDVALEIIRRKLNVTWWGNIRFEKSFTRDLATLMSESGCIAVTGGLEIAHPRLLKLIQKGVTVEQVAQCCLNFQNAGIMVHAYLMYGFPTQTEQELIDSLEMVRQFFNLGLIQSAFWHRFALTVHSPVSGKPAFYKIKILSSTKNEFATNDLMYEDYHQIPYEKYSFGLQKALYNFMHAIGLDWDVRKWFDFAVPKTTVPKDFIAHSLQSAPQSIPDERKRSVWLNDEPLISEATSGYKKVQVHFALGSATWKLLKSQALWLVSMLEKSRPDSGRKITFADWKNSFPSDAEEFEKFLQSSVWKELRESGLLFV
jgi:radical SAM superfamily enzyme YgiQ (UPF0313 family)